MTKQKDLIILPFDHRGSFMEKMFNIMGDPTSEQVKEISFFKKIIYEGFKIAVKEANIPVESAGILVDEQFGDEIIKDAKKEGFVTCICAEKSGQEEFDFEYGDDWKEHIEKYNPDFVKILIRYNPEGDQDMNERQAQRIKLLSDFCLERDCKLMIEPLVVATEKQKEIVDGDMSVYDKEMRPELMQIMVEELQNSGIEPKIWKVEGLEEAEDYDLVGKQVKFEDRDSNIIILGRHADDEQLKKWLSAGARDEAVVGFAIGRSIFWDPLVDYRDGKIEAEEASKRIAERFIYFYKFFEDNRK